MVKIGYRFSLVIEKNRPEQKKSINYENTKLKHIYLVIVKEDMHI